MITNFKIFENLGGYNLGDVVLILYKIPGTDKREVVPVKIITEDGIHYQFSFNVANNPFSHQRPISFDKNMIINKADSKLDDIKEPYKPSWQSEQPMSTDYSPAANPNQITNDFVLPNS
jgi:hypothetical protein